MSAEVAPPVGPSAQVVRAARALVVTARASREVVSYEDRLDFAATSVLSLAQTSSDPLVVSRLLVEVAEVAARLAHVIGDAGGERCVEDALAGRPVDFDWRRSRGAS